MLHGKNAGIWEWRFRDLTTKIQQRLLGVFAKGQPKTAIFLLGCNHKQKVYQPVNCLDTAKKRANSIKSGDMFNERKVRTDI